MPTTWDELTATAQKIQDAERAEAQADLWGFVWQGNAYEGLTCNALEWIKSNGGGQIVEPDGTISVNNEKAVEALEMAAGWVGTISPRGVLAYRRRRARGVWQTGNAVFMRNWPYAYALGNGDDSPIKGMFDVAPLPSGGGDNTSAATLGGWNLAVSKYSPNPEAAIELAHVHGLGRGPEAARADGVATCRRSSRSTTMPRSPRRSRSSRAGRTSSCNAVPRPSAPTKVELQRGLVEVLVGGARDAVGQRHRRPRTSSSSSSTSTS